MSMNVTALNVRIHGIGDAKITLDNDKGFNIISEFRKRGSVNGVAMRYKDMIVISVDFRKGIRGLPNVFKRGSVLYSPIYDALIVVLNDFESREHNYVEIGYVDE